MSPETARALADHRVEQMEKKYGKGSPEHEQAEMERDRYFDSQAATAVTAPNLVQSEETMVIEDLTGEPGALSSTPTGPGEGAPGAPEAFVTVKEDSEEPFDKFRNPDD